MKKISIPFNQISVLVVFKDEIDESDREMERVVGILVESLNLRMLKKVFYRFRPVGKTLLFVLSQSHLAIHTFPENKMIHLDLVSCSGLTKEEVTKALHITFKGKRYKLLAGACNFDKSVSGWSRELGRADFGSNGTTSP